MVQVLQGSCLALLKEIPTDSVNACVTSPPYWGMRDYKVTTQIGAEQSPDAYIQRLGDVFDEVKRVLRPDGTCWLNLGDGYNNSSGYSRATKGFFREGRIGGSATKKAFKDPVIKVKDLMGLPWAVAFELRRRGWYLRQEIIWAKPNPMPEPVKDRCTSSHEHIFLLSKSAKYYFKAIQEPAVSASSGNVTRKQRPNADVLKRGAQAGSVPWKGTTRNKRDVWTIAVKPFKGAHFATYPPELIEPCISASVPKNGTVLDPFAGSGTTGLVAQRLGVNAILCELNKDYIKIIKNRLKTGV